MDPSIRKLISAAVAAAMLVGILLARHFGDVGILIFAGVVFAGVGWLLVWSWLAIYRPRP